MNWKGNLIGAALWLAAIGGLSFLVYSSVHDAIQDYNMATQLVTTVSDASRGKVVIIDVRVEDKALKIFYESSAETNATGMTKLQSEQVKEIINANLEWAMIHREVITIHFNWAREDRSGKLYQYYQIVCLAQHIVEESQRPECQDGQQWFQLPKRNQRFRT